MTWKAYLCLFINTQYSTRSQLLWSWGKNHMSTQVYISWDSVSSFLIMWVALCRCWCTVITFWMITSKWGFFCQCFWVLNVDKVLSNYSCIIISKGFPWCFCKWQCFSYDAFFDACFFYYMFHMKMQQSCKKVPTTNILSI